MENGNGRVAGAPLPLNPYSDCPPRGTTPIYPVVYARVGQTLHCIALGERTLGVWHHYSGGRTGPCLKAWGDCEGCERNAPVVWAAYLSVYLLPTRRRRVLQIPASAYRECTRLSLINGHLRGTALQALRLGKANNAPVQLVVCERRDKDPLPNSFNPGETLVHLWGLDPLSPAAKSYVYHGALASVRDQRPGDTAPQPGQQPEGESR